MIKDISDVTRIIKSLENSTVLIDEFIETVKHESKNQEDGFLGILLGTLGVSMLENILARKSVLRAGKSVVRAVREPKNTNHIDKNF